jgi:hypothetical protein
MRSLLIFYAFQLHKTAAAVGTGDACIRGQFDSVPKCPGGQLIDAASFTSIRLISGTIQLAGY